MYSCGLGSMVKMNQSINPTTVYFLNFKCIYRAPPLERSRMATIAYAGNYAGTIVSMPVSGILANTFGWESLFYVFGKKSRFQSTVDKTVSDNFS